MRIWIVKAPASLSRISLLWMFSGPLPRGSRNLLGVGCIGGSSGSALALAATAPHVILSAYPIYAEFFNWFFSPALFAMFRHPLIVAQ